MSEFALAFAACFCFLFGVGFGYLVGRLHEQRRAAIAKAKSLVRLGEREGSTLTPDVDECIPKTASNAKEVEAVLVNLRGDGAKQHLKAAGSALPHGDAPVARGDRTAAEATGGAA